MNTGKTAYGCTWLYLVEVKATALALAALATEGVAQVQQEALARHRGLSRRQTVAHLKALEAEVVRGLEAGTLRRDDPVYLAYMAALRGPRGESCER